MQPESVPLSAATQVGRAVHADHVDGPVDRGDGKVVSVLAGVFHVRQLVRQVVTPAVGEVAAQAHDRDHVLVGGHVLARAAFDVALQGHQRRAVADDVARAHGQVERRNVGQRRGPAGEVRRVAAAHAGPVSANGFVLLPGQQRVVAGNGFDGAEGSRIGDLRVGLRVHPAQVGVGFDAAADFKAADEPGVQALVGPLKEIGGVVVECLSGPGARTRRPAASGPAP